jgi:hypothetical protein
LPDFGKGFGSTRFTVPMRNFFMDLLFRDFPNARRNSDFFANTTLNRHVCTLLLLIIAKIYW